jgi:outer membrane protein
MGMPMETTKSSFLNNAFEVTPQDFHATADVTGRTEYLLLKKQEQLLTYQKKAVQAAYYPTLSLSWKLQLYWSRSRNALVCKTS